MGEESSTEYELELTDDFKESKVSLYSAILSDEFLFYYNNVFSVEKLNLIDDFLDHFEKNGLSGWKGKVSPSWKVPEFYKDHKERAKYAQDMNLWHAHIGLPTWQNRQNVPYLTSNQVLHFQKIDNFKIHVLTVSSHNPMDLPDVE